MAIFRTSNPVLKQDSFDAHEYLTGLPQTAAMTIEGTLNKCMVLFAILIAAAAGGVILATRVPDLGLPLLVGGVIAGLVLAIAISVSPRLAPKLAPVYAAAEGLFLGILSYLFNSLQRGIVLNAAVLTVGVAGTMFLLYRARVIRATPMFTRVIVFSTCGIALLYLVNIVGRLLGYTSMPFLHEGTPIGIAFSLFVVGIAAMNLILDFNLIERGAEERAPKFMEWYGAFGLMVTIVWLYVEILRLLSKLRR